MENMTSRPELPITQSLVRFLQGALMLALLLAATSTRPQTSVPSAPPISAPTVAFCDLLSNPQAFDDQWIQVRGRVSLAPEDFTLRDPGCEQPLTRPIWLEYGGDEPTPTTYCCGDHSRPAGKDLVVGGTSISLIRDPAMQEFIEKVKARRAHQANGEPCEGSLCNFYEVTATVTGLFLAAPENAGNPQSGYGHLGCCELLVIRRVSDVAAARTLVPPNDASFTCTTQTWQAEFPQSESGGMLDPKVANKKFLTQQMREHGDSSLIAAMQASLHTTAAGKLRWTSPDLLTIYSAEPAGSRASRTPGLPPTRPRAITITRERCTTLPDSSSPRP